MSDMLIAQFVGPMDPFSHVMLVIGGSMRILAPIVVMVAAFYWMFRTNRESAATALGVAVSVLLMATLVPMFGVPLAGAAGAVVATFVGAAKGISILVMMLAVTLAILSGLSRAFDVNLIGETKQPRKSRQEIRTAKQIEALEQIKRDLAAIDVDPDRTALRKRLMAESAQRAEDERLDKLRRSSQAEREQERHRNAPSAPNNSVVARNGDVIGVSVDTTRPSVNVGAGRLWVSPSVTHTTYPSPSKTPEKSGESA